MNTRPLKSLRIPKIPKNPLNMFDFDLTKIKAMVFDVDGVLSCSTIAMDEEGQPLRTLNVKDGYAIQLAVKRGLVVAIISGGRSQNIVRR